MKYQAKTIAVKSIGADASGELMVEAIVSAPVVDRDGDVVDNSTAKFRDNMPIFADHKYDLTSVLGSVKKSELTSDGEVKMTMAFSNKKQEAIDAYWLIADGHLDNAFSIGFTVNQQKSSVGLLITDEIMEVSVTGMPANQRARVLSTIAKSANVELRDQVLEAYNKAEEGLNEVVEETKQEAIEAEEVAVEAVEQTVEAVTTEVQETKETIVEAETSKEVEAETVPEVKEEIKEINMDIETKIAEAVKVALETKEAEAHKAAQEVVVAEVVEAKNEDYKSLTVKQFTALKQGDHATVQKLNKIAMERKGLHGATELGGLFLCEELSRDIIACELQNIDSLAALVNRVNLTTSNTWAFISKSGNLAFKRIADCAPKPDGGMISFTKKQVTVEEYALQTAYCDIAADDTIASVYDALVRDIALARSQAIGGVILTNAGDSPLNATGILVNPNVPTITLTAATKKKDLRAAKLQLATCARSGAVFVVNEETYINCLLDLVDECCPATPVTNGNFGITFDTLFGTRIIIDNNMPTGTILLLNPSYYSLITKGDVRIDTSNQAKSDEINVNAWDSDSTLVRAYTRMTGVLTLDTAAVIITCN